MPRTQSAKKALRQNLRRRARNLAKKDAYKNAVKRYKKLVGAKKVEDAKTQLSFVYKALDKAAKANVIHRNKASRLKAQLNRLLR